MDYGLRLLRDRNLKTIDRFNGQVVNGFLTAGSTAFILLHDGRSEDGIRAFFQEVYELYVKVRVASRHPPCFICPSVPTDGV